MKGEVHLRLSDTKAGSKPVEYQGLSLTLSFSALGDALINYYERACRCNSTCSSYQTTNAPDQFPKLPPLTNVRGQIQSRRCDVFSKDFSFSQPQFANIIRQIRTKQIEMLQAMRERMC